MPHESAVEENNEPHILYEDDEVVVVDKPAGLIVHGDGRSAEDTLADWLLRRSPEMKEVGEPWQAPSGEMIPRPGIVHRLDRGTSGVMIIGKTQPAFEHLKQQFQDRAVHKEYDVLIYGHLKEERGVIDKPIGRSPQDFRRWSAQPGARGEMREARTLWSVVRQGKDMESGELVAWVRAEPETGRTHQIRVHFKAIHHPVVCDPLYAAGKPCLFGLSRTALHARSLSLVLPSGKEARFEAAFPADMTAATDAIV